MPSKKVMGGQKRKMPQRRGPRFARASLHRLALRAGCKRVASSVYDELRDVLRTFMEKLVKDMHALMEVRNQRTVRLSHALFALKRRKRTLYSVNK